MRQGWSASIPISEARSAGALTICRTRHLYGGAGLKLTVTEVNTNHDPGGQLGCLVDGLVAALARQPLARSELRTIRS
jgi:hypothetical protein